jgi:dipeptidyl aminopeptidase/acylaminoacyl peptidase
MKHISLVFFLVLSCIGLSAQKTMTPNVYSEWRKIQNATISDSGHTIIYTLEREIGDKQLGIYHQPTKGSFIIERVNTASVDASGTYVVYSHGLAYDSLRTLKRKKVAKDKLPIDSISIMNVKTKNITVIDRVSGFTLPSRWSDYVVYVRTFNKETADSIAKKSPCKDQTLIIRQLSTGREDTIKQVKDYILAEEAPVILYSRCQGDSIATYTIYRRDIKTGETTTISDPYHQLTSLTMDKMGNQVAFLSLDKKSHLTKKPYKLQYYRQGEYKASDISTSASKPIGWLVSSDYKPKFTENGQRLLVGFCPPSIEKDTTLLDDEIVNVEIWHHDMPKLYTQLESSFEEDKKRAYTYVFDTQLRSFHAIEDITTATYSINDRSQGKYALITSTLPYQKEMTWMGDSRKDIDLYDFATRTKINLLRGVTNNAQFSIAGQYVIWYNHLDSSWQYYNITLQKRGTLAAASMTRWYDELHDTPSSPDSYGVGGWATNDQFALIYDRYDIWKIDPRDPLTAIPLTAGRDQRKVYRIIDLDTERDDIDLSKALLLHVFDEKSKVEHYAWLDMTTGKVTPFLIGNHNVSRSVRKARVGETLTFRRQSPTEFPDIQLTTTAFDTIVRISRANPQQEQYAWGFNQLFIWRDTKGANVEGMLFFPPNFDKKKKYPLLVNFYERSSNSLNSHRAPEAHRSSINYTYYTNKGYVIFNPDIAYMTGQPGEDCMNAVETGVNALLKLGYIDSTRMGLQGHSWGGYQIAYMLTKTGRYRCAEAGAAVVNMVSAYGGIRWESGMSRMFQYEQSQSRLGKTLWQDPALFHKNSPIYQLDKVTTPLLLMHNDEDGAVPWEQGIEYYMALRRLGKPIWLLNYNGEPHWPVKWQNRLDFNIRMEQFFDHFLMDKPMPLWMKEGNTPLEKGVLNKY